MDSGMAGSTATTSFNSLLVPSSDFDLQQILPQPGEASSFVGIGGRAIGGANRSGGGGGASARRPSNERPSTAGKPMSGVSPYAYRSTSLATRSPHQGPKIIHATTMLPPKQPLTRKPAATTNAALGNDATGRQQSSNLSFYYRQRLEDSKNQKVLEKTEVAVVKPTTAPEVTKTASLEHRSLEDLNEDAESIISLDRQNDRSNDKEFRDLQRQYGQDLDVVQGIGFLSCVGPNKVGIKARQMAARVAAESRSVFTPTPSTSYSNNKDRSTPSSTRNGRSTSASTQTTETQRPMTSSQATPRLDFLSNRDKDWEALYDYSGTSTHPIDNPRQSGRRRLSAGIVDRYDRHTQGDDDDLSDDAPTIRSAHSEKTFHSASNSVRGASRKRLSSGEDPILAEQQANGILGMARAKVHSALLRPLVPPRIRSLGVGDNWVREHEAALAGDYTDEVEFPQKGITLEDDPEDDNYSRQSIAPTVMSEDEYPLKPLPRIPPKTILPIRALRPTKNDLVQSKQEQAIDAGTDTETSSGDAPALISSSSPDSQVTDTTSESDPATLSDPSHNTANDFYQKRYSHRPNHTGEDLERLGYEGLSKQRSSKFTATYEKPSSPTLATSPAAAVAGNVRDLFANNTSPHLQHQLQQSPPRRADRKTPPPAAAVKLPSTNGIGIPDATSPGTSGLFKSVASTRFETDLTSARVRIKSLEDEVEHLRREVRSLTVVPKSKDLVKENQRLSRQLEISSRRETDLLAEVTRLRARGR